VYGDAFMSRIRAMGIRDRVTAARSPWQNGYCEREIGSIRRDCLDHVIVSGERHFLHLLCCYASYYKRSSAACTIATFAFDFRQGQGTLQVMLGLRKLYLQVPVQEALCGFNEEQIGSDDYREKRIEPYRRLHKTKKRCKGRQGQQQSHADDA
jgi:transposase InsO family protein